MRYGAYESKLGRIILGSDGEYLRGLWFEGQKYFPEEALEAVGERGSGAPGGAVGGVVSEGLVFENLVSKNKEPNAVDSVTAAAADWLDRYFAGKRPDPSELLLKPEGSPFRQTVWRLLLEIPYGQVTTYGQLAKKMAEFMGRESMSAQAVGGAVGQNPISIIIPCHRVVGTNGSLTGYAGGLQKKIRLLELEGVDLTGMKMPG